MDFPFGHDRRHNNNNHQHRRDYGDDDDDDQQPPNFRNQHPPPSFPGGFRSDEQPPNFHHNNLNQPPPTFPGGYGFRSDEQPPPPLNFHHNQPTFPGGGGGGYRVDEPPPPPFSAVTHHQHMPPPPDYYGGGLGGEGYNQPPPPNIHYQGPPPVQHVSHHRLDEDRPPSDFPANQQHHGGGGGGHSNVFSHHHTNTSSHDHQPPSVGYPEQLPTVRVYSKADTGYSLTIRDSQVVLAPSNPRDDFQHWIKDQKFSTKVKDEEGFPCFALVNKATGQAIKHSITATQPVQLVPYNPNAFDESVLWTESRDLGDSYRCIRMVNNIRLNLDAFNGDQNHGGVHDGTIAVLWEWKKGDNQRWKIAPY